VNTWKWVGLAGIAGVATVGIVAARKRRAWDEADTDQIRARLHKRLEETAIEPEVAGSAERDGGEEIADD
jgi:hypothetical protein